MNMVVNFPSSPYFRIAAIVTTLLFIALLNFALHDHIQEWIPEEGFFANRNPTGIQFIDENRFQDELIKKQQEATAEGQDPDYKGGGRGALEPMEKNVPWLEFLMREPIELDDMGVHEGGQHTTTIISNIEVVLDIIEEESPDDDDKEGNVLPMTLDLPHICSADIKKSLMQSAWSKSESEFCKSYNSGGLVLNSTNMKQIKKQQNDLDCAAFDRINEPEATCERVFGDDKMRAWNRGNYIEALQCDNEHSSLFNCLYDKDSLGTYCEWRKVRMDTSKFKDIPLEQKHRPRWNFTRFGVPNTRIFEDKFLIADCNSNNSEHANAINDLFYNRPGLYHSYIQEESESKGVCDVVYNNPTIMMSHDHIINLGHMINDQMTVWYTLWLAGLARPHILKETNLLNIDALDSEPPDSYKVSQSDKINSFFTPYLKTFNKVIKFSDFSVDKHRFGGPIVCFDKLIMMKSTSYLSEFFKNFANDVSSCSLKGPSSLVQRFNIHIRSSFNLLRYKLPISNGSLNAKTASSQNLFSPNKVIFINRKLKPRSDGPMEANSNRIVTNVEDIKTALEAVILEANSKYKSSFELLVLDFSDIETYEKQLILLSQASVLIGMHGAGISHSVHMPIGESQCCGVLEIFPSSLFSDVSHGNFVRKVGIHYESFRLSGKPNRVKSNDGAVVPVDKVTTGLGNLLKNIITKPSCILSDVLDDPYFENI